MALLVSAVIPTRGDVPLGRLADHLRQYPEITEIVFVIGNNNNVFTRYLAAAHAGNDVIYTQDDDYITDLRPILDAYQPGRITNAMTEEHLNAYRGEETLMGFGALFDKALLHVFDGWERDAVFLRDCDRVFATLNPHYSVMPKIRMLPWAMAENRLYRQPEHGANHVEIRRRIEEFRRGR